MHASAAPSLPRPSSGLRRAPAAPSAARPSVAPAQPRRARAPRAAPAAGPGPSPPAGAAPPPLAAGKCEPCEAAKGAAAAEGTAPPPPPPLSAEAAADYLSRLAPGWGIVEDGKGRLRIQRRLRTRNFAKGLELFQRVGAVAEAEGHHPDLALEGWNNVTLTLWTHSRGGLTESDFVMAAKIDAVEVGDLLSKKQPDAAAP